jgi:hypothetical protein
MMVGLEISSDNMVTLLANRVRTGNGVRVTSAILPIRHVPSIAFMSGADYFSPTGIAARFGK